MFTEQICKKKICFVVWSTFRGDGVLSITVKRWLDYSQKLGIKLYIASDSNEISYPDVILFNPEFK